MPHHVLTDLLGFIFGVRTTVETRARREGLAALRARRLAALRTAVAASPARTLADCPDGPAALEGRARPLSVEPAPLSGRPVIGYRIRLEGVFLEEDSRQTRSLLDLCAVHEHELVEEESGRVARVHPSRCLPLFAPEPTARIELAEVIRPPLAPIIDRAIVSASDLATAIELHAVEYLLEPDEPVFAYGVARRELDLGAEVLYRERPQRTILSAPEGGLLILADQRREALLASLEHEWELLPPE